MMICHFNYRLSFLQLCLIIAPLMSAGNVVHASVNCGSFLAETRSIGAENTYRESHVIEQIVTTYEKLIEPIGNRALINADLESVLNSGNYFLLAHANTSEGVHVAESLRQIGEFARQRLSAAEFKELLKRLHVKISYIISLRREEANRRSEFQERSRSYYETISDVSRSSEIKFSPRGSQLALISLDGPITRIRLLDTGSGREIWNHVDGHHREATERYGGGILSFSQDGTLLASTPNNELRVVVRDTKTGTILQQFQLPRINDISQIFGVAFTNDNKFLKILWKQQNEYLRVGIFDLKKGSLETQIKYRHQLGKPNAFSILSPDGHYVISSVYFTGGPEYITVWRAERYSRSWIEILTRRRMAPIFQRECDPLSCLSVLPAEPIVVAGSQRRLTGWNLQDNSVAFDLPLLGAASAVAFSQNGRYLAYGTYNKDFFVFERSPLKHLLTLDRLSEPVRSITFSPTKDQIAVQIGGMAKIIEIPE